VAVLRILAGVSVLLLIYEVWTLATGVLLPLIGNAAILQTDFHYYYEAAMRFRGDGAQLYQLSDDVIAGFAYPPPAIVPFVLLSYLPLGAALAIMTVSSYAAVIAAVALWIRYLRVRGIEIDRAGAIAATLVAVALAPTYSNAIFGQVNAWVLLCAVVFVTAGALPPTIGGTFLAAGVWLKIYPVLMIAEGLWNRTAWKRIACAALAGIAIALVLLPLVPPGAYQTFVNDVLPARFDKTAVHISNQSLIAFIERFAMPPDRFLNWTGEQAVTVSGGVRAVNWLFGLAVMGWAWYRATRDPLMGQVESAAGLIALAAIIAPLGWGHTYVLVLPVVLLHLFTMRHASPVVAAVIMACVAALMVPAARRIGIVEVLPSALQNVVYSRYLIVALILMALPASRRGSGRS